MHITANLHSRAHPDEASWLHADLQSPRRGQEEGSWQSRRQGLSLSVPARTVRTASAESFHAHRTHVAAPGTAGFERAAQEGVVSALRHLCLRGNGLTGWEYQDHYGEKVDAWQVGCMLHELLQHGDS
jgi:hypothetical protein